MTVACAPAFDEVNVAPHIVLVEEPVEHGANYEARFEGRRLDLDHELANPMVGIVGSPPG